MPLRVTTQPLRFCVARGLTSNRIEMMGGKIEGPNVLIDSNAPGFDEFVKVFNTQFKTAPPAAELKRKSEERMRRLGPPLWAELHRWALAADVSSAAEWLKKFTLRVPCGECRREFRAILREMPIAFDLFAWSVQAHNRVNRKLGKPEMSVEDARRWIKI